VSGPLDTFVFSTAPLALSDAVAAIILVEGKYLLQRRDDRPDIWYPNHWGLFGGAVEPDENPIEALARELHEELELVLPRGNVAHFCQFDFEVSGAGVGTYFRKFYTVAITPQDHTALRLHEGAEMRLFTGAEMLSGMPLSPYDSFALFLHHARARFARPA
jgi:8-oxo-dGTP pyrophosphatase MutT (NUDIX family)